VTDGKPGSYDVPEGHDARVMLGSLIPDRPQSKAVVRARAGTGQALRRRALEQTSADDTGDAAGWTRLVVPYTDAEVLAEEITSYGPDVVAEEPIELRTAIVRRLRSAVIGLDPAGLDPAGLHPAGPERTDAGAVQA
jgi:hypothetical protein